MWSVNIHEAYKVMHYTNLIDSWWTFETLIWRGRIQYVPKTWKPERVSEGLRARKLSSLFIGVSNRIHMFRELDTIQTDFTGSGYLPVIIRAYWQIRTSSQIHNHLTRMYNKTYEDMGPTFSALIYLFCFIKFVYLIMIKEFCMSSLSYFT